mmetsp:Transcript_22311/g.56425  ORF Transcript_22311/g.56425 Transcript_22311/m.56425 type:complete len:240 (-) Transcript_22311:278-997(-)
MDRSNNVSHRQAVSQRCQRVSAGPSCFPAVLARLTFHLAMPSVGTASGCLSSPLQHCRVLSVSLATRRLCRPASPSRLAGEGPRELRSSTPLDQMQILKRHDPRQRRNAIALPRTALWHPRIPLAGGTSPNPCVRRRDLGRRFSPHRQCRVGRCPSLIQRKPEASDRPRLLACRPKLEASSSSPGEGCPVAPTVRGKRLARCSVGSSAKGLCRRRTTKLPASPGRGPLRLVVPQRKIWR